MRVTPAGDRLDRRERQLCQTGSPRSCRVMFAVLAPFATVLPAAAAWLRREGFRTWLLIATGLTWWSCSSGDGAA